MKRKNASLLGNVLCRVRVGGDGCGVGYSILNQLPQLNATILCAWRNLSIFVGAVLWLAVPVLAATSRSATATGVRHYDKRCRRNQHRHS